MKDAKELFKEKKKVFCNKCRHLEYDRIKPKCWGYSKDSWLEAGGDFVNPMKKNKFNDCTMFEDKNG